MDFIRVDISHGRDKQLPADDIIIFCHLKIIFLRKTF